MNDPKNGKLTVPAPGKSDIDAKLVLIEPLMGLEPPFSLLASHTASCKGY